jgi:hypothetical protein
MIKDMVKVKFGQISLLPCLYASHHHILLSLLNCHNLKYKKETSVIGIYCTLHGRMDIRWTSVFVLVKIVVFFFF